MATEEELLETKEKVLIGGRIRTVYMFQKEKEEGEPRFLVKHWNFNKVDKNTPWWAVLPGGRATDGSRELGWFPLTSGMDIFYNLTPPSTEQSVSK